ncbi:hemerythrin domain-containing protein [Croceicoccus ponticola]|uniref:Hemerythrin domain-containing protein n=1 Tax=Croceicoccus ponticola TaxID=2217664 RepID=A0A437GUW1_9SPHN|nr:hemerythrin domain-containing protein [Croceicoccus ponticola]RVQ65289.1 hemerythrin domain-containing protein [Croceicoccus ponticola]
MADTSGIFDRLKEDHDKHRKLLAKMAKTEGASDERESLLEQFTIEVKSHAAAEEQALYSTMMRKPETTSDTRHSVSEHHEIEEMLNDLAATDMSSSAWLSKFKDLRHEYEHHIDEEEEEHFPEFEKHLTDADLDHMRSVFERRKQAELGEQEVTPEKMEDAKE